MMQSLKAVLKRIALGEHLTRDEARTLFEYMVAGEATGPQQGALLMGLRVRGETIDEIVGAALAMRARMRRVRAPAGAVDIVGTGGDGHGTFNISTATAFVVAGCGVPVAKHGNRAVSSKSGAADVLTALGVEIDQDVAGVERCIAEVGLGFMFAPAHHPALKGIMPARIDLGIRTIFNVLGPLLNPAGVTHHLIGVYDRDLVVPIAEALGQLGSKRALVVHGADGMDELSTTGTTYGALLRGGVVRRFEITPQDVGLKPVELVALRGGDGAANARALRAVLDGAPGAYRDIVLLNAAGALIAAGMTEDWTDGISRARAALDQGKARAVLDRMIAVTSNATVTA